MRTTTPYYVVLAPLVSVDGALGTSARPCCCGELFTAIIPYCRQGAAGATAATSACRCAFITCGAGPACAFKKPLGLFAGWPLATRPGGHFRSTT